MNTKHMLFVGAAFASFLSSWAGSDQPNIVFIFVDDQGYYDLGCYGATEVETPRIDALAEQGIRFTDYYAAAPICSPSRAGLVTGAYPRRTHSEVWVHRPDSDEGIAPEVLTMAELFKTAGYATACVGKWHLGFKEEYLPWNQGFDHYYGVLHNLDTYEVAHFDDEGGLPLLRNSEVTERGTDPGDLTRLYTDETIDWIEERVESDEPFFVYLPHTMLHHPLGVSEAFRGSSEWGEYGDAIQEMDFHVGRILDTLEELEIDDETIVIYASDNGRKPGRNERQPIRGSKLTTYEGGIRVPCIVSGSGVGLVEKLDTDLLAHAMDWYPTLASLAGIEIPAGVILDGRDLSAFLKGECEGIPAFEEGVSLNAEVPLRRAFLSDYEWGSSFTKEEYLNAFFYHGSHGALAAVRSGKWKLALHPSLTLYDLEKDPGERKPARDGKMARKLRGMAILFQREMNH
ncbi:MAG: sulfatase-like hydrolase/transferase [Verrucomicrobiota bacterium]